jgi:hypothetical protein
MSGRFHLCKQADALLKSAGCDSMTGQKIDRDYRLNKRAEQTRFRRWWRQRAKRLGKFGPASRVRTIKF